MLLLNLRMLESSNRYQQFESGNLGQEIWQSRLANIKEVSSIPIFNAWRKSLGGRNQHPEFL
jgi:hypothetical protein